MYFPPVLRKEEDEDEEEHEIAEGEAARFSLNRRGVRLANIWQLTLALSLARALSLIANCESTSLVPPFLQSSICGIADAAPPSRPAAPNILAIGSLLGVPLRVG